MVTGAAYSTVGAGASYSTTGTGAVQVTAFRGFSNDVRGENGCGGSSILVFAVVYKSPVRCESVILKYVDCVRLN